MDITRTAIRFDRFTYVLVFLLVVTGVYSYITLPKSQNPDFTIRTAVVTSYFPGASAQQVELLVTDKLEQKIQEMPEIETIDSESRSGLSIIKVEYQSAYKDMRTIFDELRRKVSDVALDLPTGVAAPQVNDEFGDTFGHIYALSGDGFTAAELDTIAEDIRHRLLLEKNVAKVDIYGRQQESIFLEYSNTRLTELGLSPQQLANSLQTLNIVLPSGDILVDSERILLATSGNFESIEELNKALITIPGSLELLALGDVVSIHRAYQDPPLNMVHVDGVRALALAISMRDGGNIVELGDTLRTLMADLAQSYPYGISLKPLFQQSVFTQASITDFVNNLAQAVIIVIVVMMLSLGIRIGLVVACLIPVVMLATFSMMNLFTIGIHQVSLAALIIALGLLVDNAIVVVEATLTRRQSGQAATPACIDAAREMMIPLLISSLTTAVAFTPIALAKSNVGEFTVAIFYVVSLALLLSWLVSMTFIPMLTRRLKIKPVVNHGEEKYTSLFYRQYRALLIACLRRPLAFCLLVLAVFILAMASFRYVPQVFIPPSEDPVLTVRLEYPLGTSITTTERSAQALIEYLRKHDQAQTGYLMSSVAFIGSGGPRFVLGYNPPNQNQAHANMIINVANTQALDITKQLIEDYMYTHYPDIHVQVKRLQNGPPVEYPIEIRISGEDIDQLYTLSEQTQQILWQHDTIASVKDSWGALSKKLIIKIDQARALRAGVSNADIAISLRSNLSGLHMTDYREDNDIIPVMMRSYKTDREDLTMLENITIFSDISSASVPLKQVADIELAWEAGLIERRNAVKTIKVQAQLSSSVTAATVVAQLLPQLEQYAATWPPGYFFELGGDAAESSAANASIIAAFPFALMVIILLLIAQFNSLRQALIILITIPLGLIGVVAGLLITQAAFGFFTLLGIISLAGIVINNAIVLLDRIRTEIITHKRTPADAILTASQQRIRPILLTTATTMGGMLPLWLGGGPMFETLAIAILFGLLFATAITLLIVPVLYRLAYRVDLASLTQLAPHSDN